MAIGYACLTAGIKNTKLSGCILKNATEEKLRCIILKNMEALNHIIDYNIENNIRLFRVSSDIIPFGSHPVNQLPWWKDYKEKLDELGAKIKRSGIRISMHPGQYTVLNSPDAGVVQKAIRDLEYHDRLLAALRADESCKLVLHIGGSYGDKVKAANAFIMNYGQLPESIRNRLVIENDDRNYNIEDILQISSETGAPAIFDNLHHKLNPPDTAFTDAEWIIHCGSTWKERDGLQKIHYSQQKEGGKPGCHSDTILIDEFMAYYVKLPYHNLDIMLEVKDKNISAVKCMKAIDSWLAY